MCKRESRASVLPETAAWCTGRWAISNPPPSILDGFNHLQPPPDTRLDPSGSWTSRRSLFSRAHRIRMRWMHQTPGVMHVADQPTQPTNRWRGAKGRSHFPTPLPSVASRRNLISPVVLPFCLIQLSLLYPSCIVYIFLLVVAATLSRSLRV